MGSGVPAGTSSGAAKRLKRFASQIPLGRLGAAEDIAKAALFPASGYSSYVKVQGSQWMRSDRCAYGCAGASELNTAQF